MTEESDWGIDSIGHNKDEWLFSKISLIRINSIK